MASHGPTSDGVSNGAKWVGMGEMWIRYHDCHHGIRTLDAGAPSPPDTCVHDPRRSSDEHGSKARAAHSKVAVSSHASSRATNAWSLRADGVLADAAIHILMSRQPFHFAGFVNKSAMGQSTRNKAGTTDMLHGET